MRKYYLIILLLLPSFSAFCQPNKQITIRYYAPNAEKASWYWYINNLELLSPLPPNTQIDWKIMRTDMAKRGGFFECTVTLPPNLLITHGFSLLEKTSLTKKPIGYIDFNNKYPTKNYLFSTDTASIIYIHPNRIDYKTNTYLGSRRFCTLLVIACTLFFIVIHFLPTRKFKSLPITQQSPTRWVAVVSSFIVLFIVLRLFNASLTHYLFASPKTILFPLLYSVKEDIALLLAVAAILFLIEIVARIKTQWLLHSFTALGTIIWLANFFNAKFFELTNQNFNYQWLYYASFFNSADSTLALAANINKDVFITLASFAIVGVLIYSSFKKILSAFHIILITGLISISIILLLPKPSSTLPEPQNKNAIVNFVQSLSTQFGPIAGIEKQANEFKLNNNTTLPRVDSFPAFKNIIVLVLESVSWKYLSLYNESINTTPFLHSIKNKTWQFENIYAHVPATNKSMESLLCAGFPYLSFKTITYENPKFPIPSIADVLTTKKYSPAFFTSGDTRYLNQHAFLKNHGFSKVEDYRSINSKKLFTQETEKEFLSGMPDSILHQQMISWIDQQQRQPFFCMAWTFQTHYPYFSKGKNQFNTNNIFKERYLNAIKDADALIQQLYRSLEKRNLLDSTLIVVVGDHGEAFGEHGQTTHATNIYEENVHIPFLLIHPSIQQHRKINTPGAISDIAPTILHLLNASSPNSWQGESLFDPQKRKDIYLFTPYGDHQFGIISNNKKLIVNDTRITMAWYNLATDSLETKNTIHTDSVAANNALKKLQSWIQYQLKTHNSLAYAQKQ